ncbi:zinc-binding alcohol dehydrogenase family protein [Lactobacillus sp. YT155]|uniref:zinc-binding alcohol dehydrogenase family protein n=1 Tax=Lactobacillus sp. YT155 TaxID=3060955 RepID=UPI00265D9AA8|nr:zinc-binding alcohol dehydrogenase family protein [Lactobacillus sp. YT155]MDO1605042.1 zinc-binding alcohol dehydrogenase family protein [Lactobacillus sp. YT155]
MRAFGFKNNELDGLVEFNAAKPELRANDILVEIQAVALNPVDTITRKQIKGDLVEPLIVGYDGYGEIVELGSNADKFSIGDKVFFAGDHTRSGSYAELMAVDERTAALAPKNVDAEHAVAIPLTGLTAYESLVDKIGIDFQADNSDKKVLIINGSGGVGSIAIQLAKIAGLQVIATASPKNQQWVQELGADIVVDHHQDLVAQLNDKKISEVDDILVFSAVDPHWQEIVKLIKPFGRIVSITSITSNLNDLKTKAASFEWEYMFAKTMYQTPNLATQGQYLQEIADWLTKGKLESTVTKVYQGINVENIKEATELLDAGHMIGKIVIKK